MPNAVLFSTATALLGVFLLLLLLLSYISLSLVEHRSTTFAGFSIAHAAAIHCGMGGTKAQCSWGGHGGILQLVQLNGIMLHAPVRVKQGHGDGTVT